MGTTPAGLPYPEGTDAVTNGDDAIKALALAIAVSLDYVWTPLVLAVNWSPWSPAGFATPAVGINKFGQVRLRGRVQRTGGTFTGEPGVIATIATTSAPGAGLARSFAIAASVPGTMVQVISDGSVTVQGQGNWVQLTGFFDLSGPNWDAGK